MASEVAQQFHRQTKVMNDGFLASRIDYGTKASTPKTRDVRRMIPLNYSNPLPDNSSGSKNRPFQMAKDESGRPNAMEQVYMNQMKGSTIRGGVLKDYKYAQMILKRRATDTENIKLASQQLPLQFPPLLELDDLDKQKLALSGLITRIQDDLDTGDINSLTLDATKNLTRVLIMLAPTFDEKDITELSRVFDDMLQTVDSRVLSQGIQKDVESNRSSRGIRNYITKFINPFITVMAKNVSLPEGAKRSALLASARSLFGTLKASQPEADFMPEAVGPAGQKFETTKEKKDWILSTGDYIRDSWDVPEADSTAPEDYVSFFKGKKYLSENPLADKASFNTVNKSIRSFVKAMAPKEVDFVFKKFIDLFGVERVGELYYYAYEADEQGTPAGSNATTTTNSSSTSSSSSSSSSSAPSSSLPVSEEAEQEEEEEEVGEEEAEGEEEGLEEYDEADYSPEAFAEYLTAGDSVSAVDNATQTLRREYNYLLGKLAESQNKDIKARQAYRRVAKNSKDTPGATTINQLKQTVNLIRNELGLAPIYDV